MARNDKQLIIKFLTRWAYAASVRRREDQLVGSRHAYPARQEKALVKHRIGNAYGVCSKIRRDNEKV